LRRDRDDGACTPGLFHHFIDFLFAPYIVPDRKLGRTWRRKGHFGVMREIAPFPNREPKARLQVEKSDRSMLKLLAYDPLSRQSKPIPVKPQ
jgi:hypothetical protein